MSKILIAQDPGPSTIGKELKLQGCVRLEGDLVIEGYVEGPVHILGNLEIKAGGVVRGDIVADMGIVSGTIIGDIRSRKDLTVLDGARIHGDVRSPRVSVSHHAQHRGNVSLVQSLAERNDT